jgi:hypothetical protein
MPISDESSSIYACARQSGDRYSHTSLRTLQGVSGAPHHEMEGFLDISAA